MKVSTAISVSFDLSTGPLVTKPSTIGAGSASDKFGLGRVRVHHPAWVMLDDQRLREPELPNWPPMKDFPEFNERARPPGESSPKLKKRP
jgi:hypothetical protein